MLYTLPTGMQLNISNLLSTSMHDGVICTLPTGMQLNTPNLLSRKMDQPSFIAGKVNSPSLTMGEGEPSIPHSGER